MKTYSPAYLAHIRQPVTTLAMCWKITKTNGDVILGTTHDRNIIIDTTNTGLPQDSGIALDLSGVYDASAGITVSEVRKNSDMAVDNAQVTGALADAIRLDVSVADIEAGLFDGATITTFRVNWQDPNDFQDVIDHGPFGQIEWTQEGEYRVEVRGVAQLLQQNIGQTAGDTCNVVEFGDARCKYDVLSATGTGVVTAVTSRRRFDSTITLGPVEPVTFSLGKVTFITGDNTGYTRQVKLDSVDDVLGRILLFDPFPLDIEIGDQFQITPGCDRRFETCQAYDNIINMRAAGIYAPGPDEIIRAP